MKNLNAAQTDRAVGVLLAAACGDALGAGYEFTYPPANLVPEMIGGGLGGFAPGEWTDDTAQAAAVAEVAATGLDLRTPLALTMIAQRFADWYAGSPADVGIRTSAVLRSAGRNPTGETMAAAARQVHDRMGRSAGNGSLMRTGVIALAYLDDPAGLVDAAIAVSALTHHDPLAGQACAVWCLMIRHAIRDGEFPTYDDIAEWVPDPDFWREVIVTAETDDPGSFTQNGWVVGALQAAWSAITHTPVPADVPCRHLQDALGTAIRIGHDTDTVAAIAGALLGARWGASAVPAAWRRLLHGWPSRHGQDLVELSHLIVGGGKRDRAGWPGLERLEYSWNQGFVVQHPHDEGVWLGDLRGLDLLPPEVDAVVTLCRYGRAQVPASAEHVVFRLIDTTAEDNPNLGFVLDDVARTVAELRTQGRVVYLHCVAAQSRTPTTAAAYSTLLGHEPLVALQEICAVLPDPRPNPALVRSLSKLKGVR